MTDLSGYAEKFTANGGTRSSLRGIGASLSLVGQPTPIPLTSGKFNSRSLVAGFHASGTSALRDKQWPSFGASFRSIPPQA